MTYFNKNIGIYLIQNNINGKCYVGQSRNIQRRWKEHLEYSNSAISKAIQKHGKENFTFSILENCSIEELDELEKVYIKEYDSYKSGYNLTIGGQGAAHFGKKLDIDDIEKISKDLSNGREIGCISEEYGVSNHSIGRINSGETWFRDDVEYPIWDVYRDINNMDKNELIKNVATLGFKESAKLYSLSDKGLVHRMEILGLPTKIDDVKKMYGNYDYIEVYRNNEKLPITSLDELVEYIKDNNLSNAQHNSIRASVRRVFRGERESYLGFSIKQ